MAPLFSMVRENKAAFKPKPMQLYLLRTGILVVFALLITLKVTAQRPVIILKLDDFYVKDGVISGRQALDTLADRKVKAGLGFIVEKSDETLANFKPYLQLKAKDGAPLFEIWHHGLDHKNPEFSGTGYEYQKQHFDSATHLMKQLSGVQMHSFGAPYNASDSNTNRVISEDRNYKVSMFNKINPSEKDGFINLSNRINVEITTGKPDYEYFVANYQKSKSLYKDYIVLQAHPPHFKDDAIVQFTKIIDFLIAEGFSFETPYSWYLKHQKH
jgi:peptidoglycan/xylan/chitin deacetylase (PgdA/CDA1 family)